VIAGCSSLLAPQIALGGGRGWRSDRPSHTLPPHPSRPARLSKPLTNRWADGRRMGGGRHSGVSVPLLPRPVTATSPGDFE